MFSPGLKYVFNQTLINGNHISFNRKLDSDKNLCIFFRRLSNLIGIGKALAKLSKLTCLRELQNLN